MLDKKQKDETNGHDAPRGLSIVGLNDSILEEWREGGGVQDGTEIVKTFLQGSTDPLEAYPRTVWSEDELRCELRIEMGLAGFIRGTSDLQRMNLLFLVGRPAVDGKSRRDAKEIAIRMPSVRRPGGMETIREQDGSKGEQQQ